MSEEEKPRIRLTPEIVARFAAYYLSPGNGAWGSLHVILDDDNVGQRSAEFCRDWARKDGDTEGAELAELLMQMTKSQQGRLHRKVSEYIRRDVTGTRSGEE